MDIKTIGVLGGMGPESTAIFYHSLIKQCQKQYGAKQDEDYPEIFIYSLPIPDVVQGLDKPEETRKALIKAAMRIDAIGVDFMVMPCNTTHYFYPEMAESISVPFISIFLATAKKVKADGFKKVGLLATETTMEYKSYAQDFEANGINLVFPESTDQKKITNAIRNILAGKKLPGDKRELVETMQTLKQKGAEAVILACTDLPILLKQEDIDVKIYDTVDVLAEVAVKYATGKTGDGVHKSRV